MRLTRSILFLAAMAAISCRTDDEVGGATPDAAVSATGTSVKAFLNGNPATDTMVTLESVVVVSHVSSRDDGKIWVQDPGGGAQSGMMLFCDFDSMTQMCPMSRTEVDGLKIGDVIKVEGKFVKVFSNRVNQV